MPYAKKSNEGLFIVKDFYYGYGQIAHHTLITSISRLGATVLCKAASTLMCM